MDNGDKSEALIRRNRLLVAKATEERRVCQEARVRMYETWQISYEIRRRASTAREKSHAARQPKSPSAGDEQR